MEDEVSEIGGLQQAQLVDKIQQLFAGVGRTKEIEALEKQILDLAIKELYEERRKAVAAQMAEHRRQTDQLEKRIAKLTSILGVTEEELKRVMAMKNIDAGVARSSARCEALGRGQPGGDEEGLMSEIFKQNLSFPRARRETADAVRTRKTANTLRARRALVGVPRRLRKQSDRDDEEQRPVDTTAARDSAAESSGENEASRKTAACSTRHGLGTSRTSVASSNGQRARSARTSAIPDVVSKKP
jgi:hypothetical protein